MKETTNSSSINQSILSVILKPLFTNSLFFSAREAFLDDREGLVMFKETEIEWSSNFATNTHNDHGWLCITGGTD